MFKWFRPAAIDPLSVSMAGAKLGDRVLVVGCGDPRLIAALAAKAGLTGRACAVDESPERATEAGASRARAKARSSRRRRARRPRCRSRPPRSISSFCGMSLGRLESQLQMLVVQEASRVLRPGGRCMVIDTLASGGMASLIFRRGDAGIAGRLRLDDRALQEAGVCRRQGARRARGPSLRRSRSRRTDWTALSAHRSDGGRRRSRSSHR